VKRLLLEREPRDTHDKRPVPQSRHAAKEGGPNKKRTPQKELPCQGGRFTRTGTEIRARRLKTKNKIIQTKDKEREGEGLR